MRQVGPGEGTSRKRSLVKLAILLAIASSGILAYSFTPLGAYLQPNAMEGFFDSIAGYW